MAAHNLPQDQLTKKNKMKKCRKRAAETVNLHESASAELESNAMKGSLIYGGEELKFDTHRMIEARETNSSTLKETVIHPTVQRARNMKVTDLRDILVAAYPHQKKNIMRMKKVKGHSDPPGCETLVDMAVQFWNQLESASVDADVIVDESINHVDNFL